MKIIRIFLQTQHRRLLNAYYASPYPVFIQLTAGLLQGMRRYLVSNFLKFNVTKLDVFCTMKVNIHKTCEYEHKQLCLQVLYAVGWISGRASGP